MLAIGSIIGLVGAGTTYYGILTHALPQSVQGYSVLIMVGGFAVALWAVGTAPQVDSVLYRAYMELRQKSANQDVQLAKQEGHLTRVINFLEVQTDLIGKAVTQMKGLASDQTKSAEFIEALAERNVYFQKEIMRLRPRRLADRKADIDAAAFSRMEQYIQTFGDKWGSDADGNPTRLCIAIASIGGEKETIDYRNDFKEAFERTFVIQLEQWTAGLPGYEEFAGGITVIDPEKPTNRIHPMVIEALKAGGVEPRRASYDLLLPWRERRAISPVMRPGGYNDYQPVVYIVVGQR